MSLFKSISIIGLSLALLAPFAAQADKSATASYKLKPLPEMQQAATERFPGDPAEHKVVYMWNKSEDNYQLAILNSIQAMIKLYGDNVEIAVVVIGPGIHALANKPQRPVEASSYERIASFAKDYRVRWVACGSTMNTLKWTDTDMRPFAEHAEVGAAALMRLQEEGFKAIFW